MCAEFAVREKCARIAVRPNFIAVRPELVNTDHPKLMNPKLVSPCMIFITKELEHLGLC